MDAEGTQYVRALGKLLLGSPMVSQSQGRPAERQMAVTLRHPVPEPDRHGERELFAGEHVEPVDGRRLGPGFQNTQ